jgi:membrane associated rhomboid family serine protease
MLPIKDGVSTRFPPVVTWCLVAANSAIFLVQISLTPVELGRFVFQFALIPARYFGPAGMMPPAETFTDYLPFATNMFLHGGWLHLILNMWTLWIFGPAVEDRLGSGRYLLFYLVAGVVASLTHALFNPTSYLPALGASGAIAGMIGCYVRLFPFARLIVMIPILFLPLFFEVPALLFAGFWFLMQILQGTVGLLMPTDGGGVAWWAHIGGFVAGLLLTPAIRRPARGYRPYFSDEGTFGFTPNGHR